jgi:hypothetical protein
MDDEEEIDAQYNYYIPKLYIHHISVKYIHPVALAECLCYDRNTALDGELAVPCNP